MWDLWWTECHWDRFFPEHFGFPLSVSFRQCFITRKNEKTNHLHHRVAQWASRQRCVHSVCCEALHHISQEMRHASRGSKLHPTNVMRCVFQGSRKVEGVQRKHSIKETCCHTWAETAAHQTTVSAESCTRTCHNWHILGDDCSHRLAPKD
jgi:hypothetical protein